MLHETTKINSCCWIRGGDGELNRMGTLDINLIAKLYIIPLSRLQLLSQGAGEADLWHFRLGHASEQCITNGFCFIFPATRPSEKDNLEA